MNVTLEAINNGFVLYFQARKLEYKGNCSYESVEIGTVREYFPTLDLAIEKLRKCFTSFEIGPDKIIVKKIEEKPK